MINDQLFYVGESLPDGSKLTSVERDRVVVSNPTKVFWTDEGYTKGDLCAYYASIADVMLPFLRERFPMWGG